MTELERAFGRTGVLILSRKAGGRTITVPTLSTATRSRLARQRLIALVGHAFAEALIITFAGDRIYIPKGPNFQNAKSRPVCPATIEILTVLGWKAPRIATEIGCSTRTVYAKRSNYMKGNGK